MKDYKGYFIDLDGTIYAGKKRIPTAEKYLQELLKIDFPFLILTNNATSTPDQVAAKLAKYYDVPVEGKHVYTSALSMIDYLRAHHNNQRIHVVGEDPLKQMIVNAGFKLDQSSEAEVVVQALDSHITYSELEEASLAIRNGATFLTTNEDHSIPTERGFAPGSGALTAFLSFTTKVIPTIVGKPQQPIFTGALDKIGFTKDEVLMIGDNYQTDILGGINAGLDTLIVFTGVTREADLERVEKQPTYRTKDLSQWRLPK